MKHNYFKVTLMLLMGICLICLLAKSFLTVHFYPESTASVNLMFKTDPLGDNFVYDRDLLDSDSKSPLRIHTDEMGIVGEDILRAISKIPLAVYLFIFILLGAVYLKIRNPKLKNKWLAIPTVGISLIVCLIWMFRTYEPSEKIYSVDKQYSFYFEIYNFNKVKPISIFYTFDFGFAGVRSAHYHYKRKIFLYDEVEQRILTSQYIGDGNDIENAKFGFDDKNNKVYLNTGDFYELPRPIDKIAIEQEKAINDSINRADFYNYPLITQEDIDYIQPVIKKWLDFYAIDITQMRHKYSHDWEPYLAEPSSESPDYRQYTEKDNRSDIPMMIYSPDKQQYIDLNLPISLGTDGKYRYDVYNEFCTYLIDRKNKRHYSTWWSGISDGIHSAFWIDNNVFILVGSSYYPPLKKLFVSLYDLKHITHNLYEIEQQEDFSNSYVVEVFFAEKGIVFHTDK